jgi:hypothetical protein
MLVLRIASVHELHVRFDLLFKHALSLFVFELVGHFILCILNLNQVGSHR